MLGGSLLGFLGTIVGVTGQSINQMIASGVMFGLASGIQETYYACLMEIVPNRLRTFYIGKWLAHILTAALFSCRTFRI